MDTIATNSNNDIYLDESNNLAISSDLQAMGNICKNAVLTRFNELIYNQGSGIPYFETIFKDNPSISNFQVAIISTLQSLDNVEKVENFSYSVENGVLKYSALILTTFGEIQLNG